MELTPSRIAYPGKTVMLGNIPVVRALPVRERRMVGPWCFLDRFGPMTFTEGKPMDVAPHPHIGLQTVTWLLDDEIQHDDSLGCAAVTRPGGVSVMTAGGGVAHTEQTPPANTHVLDGVQLWVALPDSDRNGPASFSATPEVPVIESRASLVRVFSGTIGGVTSPAPHRSPILGADLEIHPGGTLEVPLEPSWEHAVQVLRGTVFLEGAQGRRAAAPTVEEHAEARAATGSVVRVFLGSEALGSEQLHYLGPGRSSVVLSSTAGARVLLIGGPPFPETILMRWNFVARTAEEIAAAREDWQHHRRFGGVKAYSGARLEAPPLTRPAGLRAPGPRTRDDA